jgi:hypothetical protein
MIYTAVLVTGAYEVGLCCSSSADSIYFKKEFVCAEKEFEVSTL